MLQEGTMLGPYRLGARIGEGAMGVVYQAQDPRLGRTVAIKLLPPSFANDAERLRRFEQEARTLAALNHPNLVAIYDIGRDQADVPYLVMELLQGETLRERLRAGAQPERRALEWTLQITDGLAAAHEGGIVHRDLKPENIFVCRDARVKILDFGLARLALPESTADAATMAGASLPGSIIGTAGYMSPEQVRAEPVDARSDLFAVGAILFEMATGRRAFQRPSAVETMAAVLQSEPAVESGSPPAMAPGLERIALRCLEKDPRQRFQSARDLSFALQQVLAGASVMSVAAPPPPAEIEPARRPAWGLPLAAAVAGVLVAAAIAWAAWPKVKPAAPTPAPALTSQITAAPVAPVPTVAAPPATIAPLGQAAGADAATAGVAAGMAALQSLQNAARRNAGNAGGNADSAKLAQAAKIAVYPGAVSDPGSHIGQPQHGVTTLRFHTADSPRQVIEFYRPLYPPAHISEDGARARLVLMQGGDILTITAAAGGAGTQIHISDIQH